MGDTNLLPHEQLLRVAREAFDEGDDFTVAVEEEFALLDPVTLDLVNRFEEVQAAAQETGILGETWQVRDGRIASIVSQPHVWEQVLFYLAALEAYGREPYHPGPPDRVLRP